MKLNLIPLLGWRPPVVCWNKRTRQVDGEDREFVQVTRTHGGRIVRDVTIPCEWTADGRPFVDLEDVKHLGSNEWFDGKLGCWRRAPSLLDTDAEAWASNWLPCEPRWKVRFHKKEFRKRVNLA